MSEFATKDDVASPGWIPPCPLILDVLPDGLIMVDAEGRIRTWNRAMEQLTGYAAGEALGAPCSILACESCGHAGACGGTAPCRFLVAAAEGKGGDVVERLECAVQAKDGDRIPVLKNARVLRDASGKPTGMLETLTDLRPLRELERDIAALREAVGPSRTVGRLVGASDAMAEVYDRIRLAAESDATVLLLGESGTGKELVAEAIHQGSVRRDGPFVKVNCSALAESLLEAELFGHVRGAFTGAVADKIGRFEAADGGTILLDEIGDISPLIQIKLLRVLQEREFERVGESVPRKVDVRVICATHRDLRERVREGLFREDLLYRIRVFPVEIPPLRRRKSDIPLLVDAFVQRFNLRTGKRIVGLDTEALHCLMDHCWPGNVRELENAVEHAFVTCQDERIGMFDLPTEIRMLELRSAQCRDSRFDHRQPGDTAGRLQGSREEFLAILRECGWNQSAAARRLGVDRTTVWRRMKRWAIGPTGE